MRIVSINNLTPGMVISEDVYSYQGQCLAKQNTPVTLQLIEHLKFYQIASVCIFPEDHGNRTADTSMTRRMETYSQRVRKSPEFRKFKKNYTQKVSFMKENINNFITKDEDLNVDQLLDETLNLFGENSTTISMFDMLHNMRQIDDSTYAHSVNVALICRLIGKWKNFSEKDMDTLTLCGLLHDIGKSKIPNEIIGKPGKLTDSEYEEIKKHPVIGYNLIKNLNLDQRIKNAVLFHHERFDGHGYPFGLTGSEIDDFTSIVSIADVYDAMTANRCYRDGLCPFEVITIFENEGLTQFNPKYILTFLEHIANTYINNEVLLSDGSSGKIVLTNQKLTRPTIQLDNGSFINLENRLDLYVQAII
jgi:putative nucleotidyltransferase with HDIG domain